MIAQFFCKNPRLLILAVCIIVAAGVASYRILPRTEDPVLKSRVGIITTTLPAADAERIESELTESIENALKENESIKAIRSMSREGVSMVVVDIRDEISEVDPVWSKVRDILRDTDADLPEEASTPDLNQVKLKAYAALVSIHSENQGSQRRLEKVSKQFTSVLQSLSGTEEVNEYGNSGQQVLVELDIQLLGSLGLTVAEVAQQIDKNIKRQNSSPVRQQSGQLVVDVNSTVDSKESIASLLIQYGRDSKQIQLSEIAKISIGTIEPEKTKAIINGKPALVLAVHIRNDFRIDQWSEAFHLEFDRFQKTLPDDIQLDVLFEQDRYVNDRLQSLQWNLALGTLAVVGVVFLMMGWWSTIIVGIALPLSVLMILVGLRIFGIEIQQMSVTGVIIAMGLLIDNAIIIVHETGVRLKAGLTRIEAVRESVAHLGMPLFASTLTTTLTFAPIAMLPGPPGEFVGSIAMSVILAINASFFLAITLVPAMTVLLPASVLKRHHFSINGLGSRSANRFYEWSLDGLFKMPLFCILVGLFVPLLGFLNAFSLPEQFFPAADRDQIQIELELSSQASLADTEKTIFELAKVIEKEETISNVHWFLGNSAPSFYYNLVPRRRNMEFYAQALVQLNSKVDSAAVVSSLQKKFDLDFTHCRVLVRQLEQGPPFDAPVEIRVFGDDLKTLQQIGDDVRLLLSQSENVIHTRSDLGETLPKAKVKLNERAIRAAGLSREEISQQIYVAMQGYDAGSIWSDSTEIPVRVRASEGDEFGIKQLSTLMLKPRLQNGPTPQQFTMLEAIGEFQLDSNVAAIPRLDGKRMNEVKAYLEAGTLPAIVIADVKAKMAAENFRLPPGYTIQYGGESEKRNEAVSHLLADIPLLVILMITALFVLFRSFRMVFIVAVVGGLSIGIGLFILWMFNYPFGFMAILGSMGVFGVAINDSIVVLAGIRADPLAKSGDITAVRKVVTHCSRHVIATSLTTVAGFTPLVLAGGGFWPPLAITVAGGVAGATVLGLYFAPAMYLILHLRTDSKTQAATLQ